MKKILITGKNSYVGINLERWLSKYPENYTIDLISLRDDSWKNMDFSKYDSVFHVAAVVHKKENDKMKDLYRKVNCELAIEVARKAKSEGVKQFIFMSSISVYGLSGKIGKKVIITSDTECSPNSLYGKSKLEAEQELEKLANEKFKISIIRAPMIYGPNCPGNFTKLQKLVLSIPVFPLINNERSMIFIDNLSEFTKMIIDNQEKGLFFPQNKEYVNTSELAKIIANVNSKKIFLSKILSNTIKLFGSNFNITNKLFGNLVIDKKLSRYDGFQYCIRSLEQSIKKV